jgi:hypothetical protein
MMNGFICSARIYKYNGWVFEFGYCGPWPLKKDGELRKRMGRKFLKDIDGFFKLSDKEKKKHNIGGGCIVI